MVRYKTVRTMLCPRVSGASSPPRVKILSSAPPWLLTVTTPSITTFRRDQHNNLSFQDVRTEVGWTRFPPPETSEKRVGLAT